MMPDRDFRGRNRSRKGRYRAGSLILLGSALILALSIITILAVIIAKDLTSEGSEKPAEEAADIPAETPAEPVSDLTGGASAVKMSDLNIRAGAGSDISETGRIPQIIFPDQDNESDGKVQEITDFQETDLSEGPRRVLFIGDSRTIDMFADSDDEIAGKDCGNGITVFAKHGHGFDYMKKVIDDYGMDNFDILVTWMGANDHGDFGRYRTYYDELLRSGRKLMVCTVGPTDDEKLVADDHPDYENSRMTAFNAELVKWAQDNGVKVIDLYGYISSSGSITIDPADGIHYLPRPTAELWNYIVTGIG
ncbi:MAG: SGNH/GDSL hydrolase family protein [Lachnospiraceae bacterium]|nr:SGNH/GDSL hydrolase family protein [Lachnospiraceae bacterium]